MLEQLKEMIKQNSEVAETLQNCSDDFLLANASIILAALDTNNIKKDHKIKLEIDEEENVLTWTFVPTGELAIRQAEIDAVRKMYTYKLPSGQDEQYLLDLNDVTWTENKRVLAAESKRMLNAENVHHDLEKGIWIWGTNNTGKSFATVCLLNNFTKLGKTVAFVVVSDLILKTQNSFNVNSFDKQHENYIEQIRKADVVVIDDLGSERPTPWFKENVLLPIIDHRFKSNKLTIFTSNSSIDKYGNKLKNRSQNPEVEEDTNNKIVSRIRSLIDKEVEVKQ